MSLFDFSHPPAAEKNPRHSFVLMILFGSYLTPCLLLLWKCGFKLKEQTVKILKIFCCFDLKILRNGCFDFDLGETDRVQPVEGY